MSTTSSNRGRSSTIAGREAMEDYYDIRYESSRCFCGLRASIRVVESGKPTKGKLYFACCNDTCRFFQWCKPMSIHTLPTQTNTRKIDKQWEDSGASTSNQQLELEYLRTKYESVHQQFMRTKIVVFALCLLYVGYIIGSCVDCPD